MIKRDNNACNQHASTSKPTISTIPCFNIRASSHFLLLLLLSFLSNFQLSANEQNASDANRHDLSQLPKTISQGQLRSKLDEQQRIQIIKSQKTSNQFDQLIGKASGKKRSSIIANAAQVIKKAKNNADIQQYNTNNYNADFAIYDAVSFLQEDYDGDGYYQTFSVIFDADIYSYTYNQVGEVYAMLYLSQNGGPWTHYYTTDAFLIAGESDTDEYEVITTFLSGYTTAEYDVLIDLYEIGYSDIVATFSSDDTNALYALPLESADYDEVYVEPYIEVVEVHGGSISFVMIFLFLGYIFRIKKQENRVC